MYHWRRNRGGGQGCQPPTRKKGGPGPYLPPPPHFSWFTSLCLALGISIYQLPYLRQHCLGLSVRGHFRVLEMENFPHRVRGNPSHTLPNSVAPLPRMCGPPLLNMLLRLSMFTFKLGAHRQIMLSCIWLSHISIKTKLLMT